MTKPISARDRLPTDYDLLKDYGHSPAKAAEIVLDAKRGDFFSTSYVTFVRARAAGEGEL